MAKLTMMKGQMVLTGDNEEERNELSTLAYEGAKVTVTKAEAKSRKKASD